MQRSMASEYQSARTGGRRRSVVLAAVWVAACLIVLAPLAEAQFGGRPGDVVLYVLSSKGPMDFQTVPGTSMNAPASLQKFKVLHVDQVPAVPAGPPFPDEFLRQVMHEEPDDVFKVMTQYEGLPGPHRLFLVSFKTFIIRGFVRDTETDVDFPSASGTTLKDGANFGPDLALDDLQVLFWSRGLGPGWPPVQVTPIGQHGPAVPPGMTGNDYITSLGYVPLFVPWENMRRKYPTGGWSEGVDVKLLDRDDGLNSTVQLFRLRPGRRTPTFQIPAATHVYVLQGSVTLQVPGAGEFALVPNHYAFLPPGLTVRLLNVKAYEGPMPSVTRVIR
jgi:quercetin dioxygenase-like cupin family protein